MKKSTKVYVFVGAIFLLAGGIYLFKGENSVEPGKYDDFAKCLSEKGVKMYGAYWCSHCLNQKKMFGSSWKYVNYIECDPRGDDSDPEACKAAGVNGFPTWIFQDGTKNEGEISLRELSLKTDCVLPE